MGMYQYIRQSWKRPKDNPNYRQYLIQWRQEPSVVRIERPTRLDRARNLGYKPKPGVVLVRVRVLRGGRMREKIRSGRRPKTFRRTKVLAMSYQVVAERRAARKYPNCEVLNSYWVGEDGKHYWYEVILLDRNHPSILADKFYSQVVKQRGRVWRGLTSAARKSRGLRNKGRGAEKLRPSKSAVYRRKAKKQKKKQKNRSLQ